MFEEKVNDNGRSGQKSPGPEQGRTSKETTDPGLVNCPAVLTGLSREMRTNMNAIVSFSYLLNNNEASHEEKADYSSQIFQLCETMMSVFDNFLDSIIIDTGNSKIESESVNLAQTFSNLFSEFREILKKESHKDITLVTECQPLKSEEYGTDINRLCKIIRNLFQNAFANTKSGYIKMGYYDAEGKLTFYILDSGNGFTKSLEFLHTLDLAASLETFNDPFTAINLLFTRKLVNMLGGSVWIENNGLTGTGIYFSIPVESVPKTDYKANRFTDTMITI
ncbi:MAG: HAMP domain-containing sensor histidine kinase [Bacteroidota bacterium]|nr:HAMP domain-containing sensor histidine kinase [Bacteroidota bacterium]